MKKLQSKFSWSYTCVSCGRSKEYRAEEPCFNDRLCGRCRRLERALEKLPAKRDPSERKLTKALNSISRKSN
jgi:hypothetical protein